ncbi:MAG: oligosaccharide repeat unit polymerase [Bacteroidetes bacterium]|nr:oligosaccharide repeat unit polymerase [Bacteroidota bacterium]
MFIQLIRDKSIALFFLWTAPVVLFILNPLGGESAWVLWGATLSSILVSFKDRKYFVLILPFVALLSPLVGNVKIINLYPSEIFIIVSGVALIWQMIAKKKYRITLYYGDVILITMLFLVVISYIFSFEHETLLKSIYSWILLVIAFFSCRMFLTPKDIHLYLISLVASILLSSLLVIFSFYENIILNNFIHSSQVVDYIYQENLSRASYFYTNIGFLFGAVALILYVSLFSYNSKKNKIIAILSMFIVIGALSLMLEKTAITSIFLTLFITFIVFFSKFKINTVVISLLFSIVLAALIFYFYLLSDLKLMDGMHVGGFTQRLCVYTSTIEVLLNNFLRFVFVGFGPDSSILINGNLVINSAKVSCNFEQEGTIDGTYMTNLFEYGLIFILLFLIYLVRITMKIFPQIISSSRVFDHFHIYFFVIFTYFSISFISDSIGTSKVMWVAVQLFALTPMTFRNNLIYTVK